MFAVENTLKVMKPDLIPIMKHFNFKPELIDKIDTQSKNISLDSWQYYTTTMKFWSQVVMYKDSDSDLVLPNSNAEVERLFTQMNITKLKLRNRMQLQMLISILSVRSGMRKKESCFYNCDIPPSFIQQIKTNGSYISSNLELDSEFDIFL